jgi:hypothetical protein
MQPQTRAIRQFFKLSTVFVIPRMRLLGITPERAGKSDELSIIVVLVGYLGMFV